MRALQTAFTRLTNGTVPKSYVLWGAAIFALAFALRLAWISYLDSEPAHDGLAYWWMAEAFASGQGFIDVWNPSEFASNRAPGWPLTLGLLVFAVGPKVLAAKVLNVFLGAATAAGVYAIATLLRERRTGIVAGVVMAFFPSQIFFTTTMMNETFFAALATALVLLMMVWLARAGPHNVWHIAVVGLLMGFMTLVKAETLILLPTAIVLFKVLGQKWREIVQFSLILAVGMAMVITPWTVRNYIRFDQLILVRSAGNGNGGLIRSGLSPDYELHSRMGGPPPPTLRETVEYYAEGPWRIGALGANKVYDLFKNDDSFHWKLTGDFFTGNRSYLSPETEDRWSMLANGFYYTVGALALLGAPFWFSRGDKRLAVLLWFVACWSLIYLALVPKVRYHYPIMPMVTVLAAATLVTVWDRYGEHLVRRRQGLERVPASETGRPVSSPADGPHEEVPV